MVETKPKTGNQAEDSSSQKTEVSEGTKGLSVEELTDLVKRTQANFENYRKQNQAYIEDFRKMAARDIVLQLLPILDNIELALKTVPAEAIQGTFKNFLEGMQQIHSQFLEVLRHNQIVQLETVGKNFDPYCHEALMKVPSELPANKIIEEFQKGFTMYGKVLRHAKVKISAGSATGATENTNSKDNQKK